MLSRHSAKKRWPMWLLFVALLVVLSGCSFLGQGFLPSVPEGLSATQGTFVDRVRLTWEPVTDAAGYEIWRSDTQDGTYTKIGLTALPAYDDTAVKPGLTYWYKVRACNRAGCSVFTAPVSGQTSPTPIPSPPAGLTASQGTFNDLIEVTWHEVTGAQSYEVYRASSQTASFTLITSVTTTSYEDRDVVGKVVYWYKVRACGIDGCSHLSSAVSGYASATQTITGPSAPQNVSASDGTDADKVVVSWTAVANATSYLVYRADEKGGTYTFKGETTDTTWADTTATAGSTYWYKVRACNASGCSPLSNADSGYVKGEQGPPAPPSRS